LPADSIWSYYFIKLGWILNKKEVNQCTVLAQK